MAYVGRDIKPLIGKTVFILREVQARFKKPAILWSGGKDSTCTIHMAKFQAFNGELDWPVVHIDTGRKFPQMYEFRDRLAKEWNLNLVIAKSESTKDPANNIECCFERKTLALKNLFQKEHYDAIVVSIRWDEHAIRGKERFFSPRDHEWHWNVLREKNAEEIKEGDAPVVSTTDAELAGWNIYATDFGEECSHVRVHPILHWTEVEMWAYTQKEKVPFNPLYLSNGKTRYRSLGCFSEDTEVLSEAGWKQFPELNHDKVLSFSPSNNGLSFQDYTGFLEESFNGDMVHIRSKALDFLVTPDHRTFYKYPLQYNGKDYWTRVCQAGDLPIRFSLPSAFPLIDKRGSFDLSDDRLRLLMWIITEGNYEPKSGGIVVYQSTKNIENVAKIDSLLSVLPHHRKVRWKKLKNKWFECVEWRIRSWAARKLKDIIPTKELDRKMLNKASLIQLKLMFETLNDGDGSVYPNGQHVKYYDKSENQIDMYQELCTLLGRRSFKFRNRKGWAVGSSSKHWRSIKHGTQKTAYKGSVYCITVPSSYLVVRRNGTVAIFGNCIPCTKPVESRAANLDEIIQEIHLSKVAERAGRLNTKETAMDELRRKGYF